MLTAGPICVSRFISHDVVRIVSTVYEMVMGEFGPVFCISVSIEKGIIEFNCSLWNLSKTHTFYGYSLEVRNLPAVASCLISKLDRVLAFTLCQQIEKCACNVLKPHKKPSTGLLSLLKSTFPI